MPKKTSVSPKPNTLIGAPEHVPTIHNRMKVIEFCCAGFSQDQIASYFSIHADTLRKHYRNELDNSLMMRTAKLSKNVYLDALRGDRWSRNFWLTHRGGWYPARGKEEDAGKDAEASLKKFVESLDAAADKIKGKKNG